jgi:hypothetical protein
MSSSRPTFPIARRVSRYRWCPQIARYRRGHQRRNKADDHCSSAVHWYKRNPDEHDPSDRRLRLQYESRRGRTAGRFSRPFLSPLRARARGGWGALSNLGERSEPSFSYVLATL